MCKGIQVKTITSITLVMLVVLLPGCQMSESEIRAWQQQYHPPVKFPTSATSEDPDPYASLPELFDNGGPEVTEPTPEPIQPRDADHPEWRFKGNRKWTHVIIHHSSTDRGSAKSFGAYHKNVRGWSNGLGYDFVIGNGRGTADGEVEVGPRWKKQARGAHAGVNYYNEHGIGICLVGNFETGHPTEKQMAALVELLRWLQKEYKIPARNVKGHCDIKDTLCPGKNFPMDRVRRLIRP